MAEHSKQPALESTIRLSAFCQWASPGSKSHTVPIVLVFHWFPYKTATGWERLRQYSDLTRDRTWQPECGTFKHDQDGWLYWLSTTTIQRGSPEIYFCDSCVRSFESIQSLRA